jgi:hypothetical protein
LILRSCFVLVAVLPAYATVFGTIRGVVHDPDHRPIPGASLSAKALHSDWSKESQTGADGTFQLSGVPLGEYLVTAQFPGFSPLEQQVVLHSGTAPVLHFQLKLAGSATSIETSDTTDEVSPESTAATTMVSRMQIEQTPGSDRTNSLAMFTAFVPGAYVTHDQLHIRGGHQVSWAVDGVPVPNTNIASNVGPQFDPKDVDYLEVQRGGFSAEYGDRAYGLFNVTPRTGFEREKEGDLVLSYGNFHQTNDQISFGDHSAASAYYVSLNGNYTDYGLAAPGPEIIHDSAHGIGAFGTFVHNRGAADQARIVASLRRDDYQVPNTPEQQDAGVRDMERESDAFVNLTWLHTAGAGLLLTISPFYHFNRTHYVGASADDNHTSRYLGGQASFSAVRGRHNAKAGLYGFAQRDVTNAGFAPAPPTQSRLFGSLSVAFAEDQFRVCSWLTLTGGIRLTHFSGSLSENAASPRAGAAIRIPRLNWVLHGFYGRYYQAPPLSTISGSLGDFAHDQGIGFLPLRGERDAQTQIGLTVPFRGWSLAADAYNTRARNYFDHDALGNSNVFFPLTIDAARLRGLELTMRSPRLFRRAQLHLSYARQRAEGWGAVTGGLTDFAPPSERFLLDHDQRHTLSAGGMVALPWRALVSGVVYYGSGFARDSGPDHLPGHTTVDLMLAKRFGESVTVSLNALNVANRRFLLDNSLTFGGTHYSDPRQFFIQVRYRFRL